ncbi:MAG: hypothetical protein JXA90_16070, partial [Planctomycetes bacterium]|nr:hypothetical protein [Planctomycetota bacterium]
RKLLEKDRAESAAGRYLRAIALRPDDAEAAGFLQRAGYRRYGDAWLHRQGIAQREAREDRTAARRKRELELPERFDLRRLRRLRIWTDHRSGELVPFTSRLLVLIEAEEREYRRLFAPLEVAALEEGLDVVVFQSRSDYEAYSQRRGTAGIFLPQRGASAFYLPEGLGSEASDAFLRRVVLHEVAHQLAARLLGIRFAPRWLDEGLALQFETARWDPEGRIAALGAELTPHLAAAIERVRPGGAGWWGLERLIETPAQQVLDGTGEWVQEYYAQCWLIVRCLLEGGERERSVFFDLVEASRRWTAAAASPLEEVSRILSRRGLTVEMMEERLRGRFGTIRPRGPER